MRATTDEQLLRALQAGDTDSLGTLVARWEQPLFRFVFRLLSRQEDAREICQETFLRTLSRLSKLDGRKPLIHYLRRVATNLCINELRRRRPVVSLDEAMGVPARRSAASEARERRLREAVDEAKGRKKKPQIKKKRSKRRWKR